MSDLLGAYAGLRAELKGPMGGHDRTMVWLDQQNRRFQSCAEMQYRMGKAIEHLGLTFAQWQILYALLRHGAMPKMEARVHMVHPAGSNTRTLDALISRRLVSWYVDPTDTRVKIILLTDKGRQVAEEALPSLDALRTYDEETGAAI